MARRAIEAMRIHGPNERGRFIIADKGMNVWDGRMWRGFTLAPELFDCFSDAFVKAQRLAGRKKPIRIA